MDAALAQQLQHWVELSKAWAVTTWGRGGLSSESDWRAGDMAGWRFAIRVLFQTASEWPQRCNNSHDIPRRLKTSQPFRGSFRRLLGYPRPLFVANGHHVNFNAE